MRDGEGGTEDGMRAVCSEGGEDTPEGMQTEAAKTVSLDLAWDTTARVKEGRAVDAVRDKLGVGGSSTGVAASVAADDQQHGGQHGGWFQGEPRSIVLANQQQSQRGQPQATETAEQQQPQVGRWFQGRSQAIPQAEIYQQQHAGGWSPDFMMRDGFQPEAEAGQQHYQQQRQPQHTGDWFPAALTDAKQETELRRQEAFALFQGQPQPLVNAEAGQQPRHQYRGNWFPGALADAQAETELRREEAIALRAAPRPLIRQPHTMSSRAGW